MSIDTERDIIRASRICPECKKPWDKMSLPCPETFPRKCIGEAEWVGEAIDSGDDVHWDEYKCRKCNISFEYYH